MKKSAKIIVFVLLSIILFGVNAQKIQADVVDKASEYLLKQTGDSSFWNKIHALEFLCQVGYKPQVQTILKKDFKYVSSIPEKRIGYFRCWANVASDEKEKASYVDKILEIYLNPDSPDKIHAAESLAKLRVSLKEYPAVVIEDDSIGNGLLQAYLKWGCVYNSTSSIPLDYTLLFSVLDSGKETDRKVMAYGLSYMGVFDTVHWKKIVSLALAEPLSSPCVAFLLHGAVTTCPDKNTFREEIGRIRIKLRDLAVTGGKTERYEAYVALGQIGDREDWSFITDSFEEGDGDDGLISAEGWRDIQSARAYAILKMNGVQKTQGFTWLDWSVVVVFLLLMLMIGYSSSKQNKTASDYVLGGRSMNSMMIGISLFATLLSTLSYLAYPGEMIKYGPVVFTGLAAFPVANWIVGKYLIPRFMSMRVTSAYEILEIKLGKGTRNLATVFFLSLRFLWMSTIVYATVDSALIPILGLSQEMVPAISIILVLITVVYTTMGGLKAVVMTDVLQTAVMFVGVILAIVVIGWKVGSVDAFLNPALFAHWESVDFSIDATKRMTVGNIFIMTLVWQVCTAGSDQMAIQRYLATKDARTASHSYKISLAASCGIQLLLAVVGLMVMAYFTYFPGQMVEGTTIYQDADTLFPRFILIGLPAGITGLIAAAIMAAAMSSLSSGLNSSSTVIQEDIINRVRKKKSDPVSDLKMIKTISAILGIVISCSCFLISYVTGNLLDVVIKVVNLVVAPLFVLFFMALFIPFATNRGTVIAGLISLLTAVLIAFFEIFNIKVLWIMPAALIVGIVVGVICSYIESKLLTLKK